MGLFYTVSLGGKDEVVLKDVALNAGGGVGEDEAGLALA